MPTLKQWLKKHGGEFAIPELADEPKEDSIVVFSRSNSIRPIRINIKALKDIASDALLQKIEQMTPSQRPMIGKKRKY